MRILATSQTEIINFIQLSQPKLDFILLSGKSAVSQSEAIDILGGRHKQSNFIHACVTRNCCGPCTLTSQTSSCGIHRQAEQLQGLQ